MTEFWTGARVSRVLGVNVDRTLEFSGVATDTRTLAPGSLFVPLVGARYDGHAFLAQAARRGARAAVVRRGTRPTAGLHQIEVEDTLRALGRLARERRDAVTGPVVAVTGTNGKTSIKEMLACALATRWRVHATQQNLNNLIGVPLTILTAPANARALVVEAGSSERGEMARQREIIAPSAAVVSNVSAGHLQGFGSIDGVLDEKTALLDGVPIAVVGTDPPALAERARGGGRRVVTAGLSKSADVHPDAWGLDPAARGWCSVRGVRVELPLIGAHQLENAIIVLAVALELGLELGAVARALASVALPAGRCEVVRVGDRIIIQDAYNANPRSMAALLETAKAMRGERALVVVLGSMLELGSESDALHERVAAAVLAARPALVAVTGEFIRAFDRHRAALGDRLITAPDAAALGRALPGQLSGDELIVVKASRGVHLEAVLPYLMSSDETPCSTIS